MKAHVGLTIDSGQAKFSALRHFYFLAWRDENPPLRRKCGGDVRLKWWFEFQPMSLRDGAMGEPAIHCVDAAEKRRLTFAGLLQTEIGEQLDIAIGDIG
jgi:hypothetical protein